MTVKFTKLIPTRRNFSGYTSISDFKKYNLVDDINYNKIIKLIDRIGHYKDEPTIWYFKGGLGKSTFIRFLEKEYNIKDVSNFCDNPIQSCELVTAYSGNYLRFYVKRCIGLQRQYEYFPDLLFQYNYGDLISTNYVERNSATETIEFQDIIVAQYNYKNLYRKVLKYELYIIKLKKEICKKSHQIKMKSVLNEIIYYPGIGIEYIKALENFTSLAEYANKN